MINGKALNVAILGSATVSESQPEALKAFEVGKRVAELGGTVLTGACLGLPYSAVQGAKSVDGATVGVSPAMNRQDHCSLYYCHFDSDVTIFTGMGKKGRNVVLVRSADIALFLGGGMGTLNEFTIAYDELNERSVIGVLINSGGLSDMYSEIQAKVGSVSKARLIYHSDPQILVNNAFREIDKLLGRNA
jgi:uncharacterized protein (TIGR00725 family)